MSFELTNQRRNKLSDAFFGLANLVFGALVLGQFLREMAMNFITFTAGLILTILIYFLATLIIKSNN